VGVVPGALAIPNVPEGGSDRGCSPSGPFCKPFPLVIRVVAWVLLALVIAAGIAWAASWFRIIVWMCSTYRLASGTRGRGGGGACGASLKAAVSDRTPRNRLENPTWAATAYG